MVCVHVYSGIGKGHSLFLLQQWYSSLWDRFDDWLRERIEVRLKPEQLEWLSSLLEVRAQCCVRVLQGGGIGPANMAVTRLSNACLFVVSYCTLS